MGIFWHKSLFFKISTHQLLGLFYIFLHTFTSTHQNNMNIFIYKMLFSFVFIFFLDMLVLIGLRLSAIVCTHININIKLYIKVPFQKRLGRTSGLAGPYLSSQNQTKHKKKTNEITFLILNIRSLNKNYEKLIDLLSETKIDHTIIIIT